MAKSRIVLFASLALLSLASLTSCDLLFPKGTVQTYTVSGTISAHYYSLTTPITLTLSDGTSTFSTEATLTGSGNSESATYSVSGLPAGTYTVTARPPIR